MSQRIYFDESGFTGNNLLHPDQNFFAYGSVATTDDEAKEFVLYLIRKYGIQGDELKGSRLVKFSKGRKAIDEIFKHFQGRLKVSISNKKYALACKFFEYIFEPCVSENNLLFYRLDFHKFIANILYVEFVARGAGAEEIFAEFEELMRSQSEAKLTDIFVASVHPENSPVLTQIREFAQFRAPDIRTELASLAGSGTGKWVLDLTRTTLFTLLANWGQEFDVLTAVCDPSKPLQESQELFNTMIGRKDRRFSDAFGEAQPITFNLAEPIQFLDSKATYGIQIADALAAASVFAFGSEDHAQMARWREQLSGFAHYGSIIPDVDFVDLEDFRVRRNAVLLMELHSRAASGSPLLDGFPAYVQRVTHSLLSSPNWSLSSD
jgi:Protein of unknown function (DUF3800)